MLFCVCLIVNKTQEKKMSLFPVGFLHNNTFMSFEA